MPTEHAASPVDLLKSVGLRPDGPVLWGRPVPADTPGVYIVELAEPRASAPIEATRVGKWIERVPELRLDGERPAFRPLLARLQSFWLPGQTIVFIGSAAGTVGGRVAALRKTPLGDRRPYAGGHWLHTLLGLERARVWWAATDAPEEYEDALLTGFADRIPAATAAATPQPDLVLPWAVLRRPTGERRVHGITGPLLPEPAADPAPGTTIRDLPPGAADGTGPEVAPPPSPSGPRPPRTPARAAARARTAKPTRTPEEKDVAPATQDKAPAKASTEVHLSREGLERLKADLHELRAVRRPATIKRVAAARELGDLRENSEYHAAREELGFIVGRIQSLEDRLHHVVVVEAADSDTAVIGSTVVVETDGETATFLLVGSTEADPSAGRISTSSPVGRALLGHGPGTEVNVTTPSGAVVVYLVVEVR